jgi:hypothetical protein
VPLASVNRQEQDPAIRMYPDFLGIGAQKSGTTWLHDNLVRHPRIWLPPVKEMHYLDHRPPHLPKRLFGRTQYLSSGRALLRQRLLAALKGGSREDLAWSLRYCLPPRTDAWYGSLFPRIEGTMTGEVCPGYARLEEPQVAHVHGLMPDAKIIYLIRNPMERAWSALAMHFRKDGFAGVDKYSEDEIEARLRNPKTARHSDYSKNLAAWEAHYPPEQIFVGFFDDLRADPRGLLKEVLDFLGVDSSEAVLPPDVASRSNPGRGEQIPERFEGVLARVLADEVRSINRKFDNEHTRNWLAYTEDRLSC